MVEAPQTQKEVLNVVLLGASNAGKSTLLGHLLMKLGIGATEKKLQ